MMRPPELLRRLVELESPTGDAQRIAHVGEFIAAELAGLDGHTKHDGELVRAAFGQQDGVGLLLLAHMDTVWPAGTLQRMPFRIEGDHAHGPGALDMKGGITVMLEGLRRAQPLTRPVTVLVTADEEIGSPRGRPHVEELARQADAVLVLEPPVRDHTITTSRSGLARYQLRIEGEAAHSGRQQAGISAIEELAHQTIALCGLRNDQRGVRINVGQVGGGTADNVVAAEAWARVDARAWTPDDQRRLEQEIRGLRSRVKGTRITITGGVTRPPMPRSERSGELAERVVKIARGMGIELSENASGGGSDGNFAAAVGAPVIDGLGPLGAGAHALDERVSLSSIESRSELLAALLAEL